MNNAVVTYEIKLFPSYLSFHRRPSEIFLFQCVETSLNYFKIISQAYCSSWIFSNVFIAVWL